MVFNDISELYIFWLFLVIGQEIVIIKYRDKEKRKNSRGRESPDDRPSKPAPYWIGSDDKTSENCRNTCENHGNKSFFRAFNNGINKSFSFFY